MAELKQDSRDTTALSDDDAGKLKKVVEDVSKGFEKKEDDTKVTTATKAGEGDKKPGDKKAA